MPSERVRQGFRRAGGVAPESLGLTGRRSIELSVAAAWRAAAGAILCRRAHPTSLRDGLLEVVVTDAQWWPTVLELLPGLAARIALDHPRLGIRRCRAVARGVAAGEDRRTFDLDASVRAAPVRPAPPAPQATHPPVRPPAEREARLLWLAERYLDRAAGKTGQNP